MCSTLEALLECSVCLELLDETSKALPCQHTFCRSCLEEIIETRHELRCPECRVLVTSSIDELPSNILLNRILDGLRAYKKDANAEQPKADLRTTPGLAPNSQTKPAFMTSGAFLQDAKIPATSASANRVTSTAAAAADYELSAHIPQCRARYAFQLSVPSASACLKFNKGAIITVVRRLNDQWAEGVLDEHKGAFPISFVELNPLAAELLKSRALPFTSPASSTSSALNVTSVSRITAVAATVPVGGSMSTSNADKPKSSVRVTASNRPPGADHQRKRHSAIFRQAQANSILSAQAASSHYACPPPIVQERCTGKQSVGTPSQACDSAFCSNATSRQQNVQADLSYYVALFSYKRQKDDEINLKRGDIYGVIECCKDGWFRGVALADSAAERVEGYFPGNYCRQIPSKPLGTDAQCRLVTNPADELASVFNNLRLSTADDPLSSNHAPANKDDGSKSHRRSTEFSAICSTSLDVSTTPAVLGSITPVKCDISKIYCEYKGQTAPAAQRKLSLPLSTKVITGADDSSSSSSHSPTSLPRAHPEDDLIASSSSSNRSSVIVDSSTPLENAASPTEHRFNVVSTGKNIAKSAGSFMRNVFSSFVARTSASYGDSDANEEGPTCLVGTDEIEKVPVDSVLLKAAAVSHSESRQIDGAAMASAGRSNASNGKSVSRWRKSVGNGSKKEQTPKGRNRSRSLSRSRGGGADNDEPHRSQISTRYRRFRDDTSVDAASIGARVNGNSKGRADPLPVYDDDDTRYGFAKQTVAPANRRNHLPSELSSKKVLINAQASSSQKLKPRNRSAVVNSTLVSSSSGDSGAGRRAQIRMGSRSVSIAMRAGEMANASKVERNSSSALKQHSRRAKTRSTQVASVLTPAQQPNRHAIAAAQSASASNEFATPAESGLGGSKRKSLFGRWKTASNSVNERNASSPAHVPAALTSLSNAGRFASPCAVENEYELPFASQLAPSNGFPHVQRHKSHIAKATNSPVDSRNASANQRPTETYRCIAAYPPCSTHELSLEVGDLILVHRKRSDGWLKGLLVKPGSSHANVGWFPSSFAEKL